MKLALVRRRFAATGGAELYLQRLMAELGRQGHDIHLLTEAWEGQPDAISVHTLPVHGNRAQRPVAFADAVDQFLQSQTFDVVFSLERTRHQDIYRAGDGLHRAWLGQRRLHAPWWKRWTIGLGAFHRNMLALEAQTLHPANTRHLIVNSNMVADEIQTYHPFPKDRIHLVRNGIDVHRFSSANRTQGRARFGLTPDHYALLFVGSGWERKGLPLLLRAFDRLPDPNLRLIIVGKGKIPRHDPNRVRFTGPLREVELACAAADLFVFPPIYEPSANVCIEALAAGLPVITNHRNGAAESIEPGRTGTILPTTNDPVALATAILEWRNRGPLRVQSSHNLSLERNVQETLQVIHQAARERSR